MTSFARLVWLVALVLLVSLVNDAQAQKFVANYDEQEVPDYELPDPLRMQDGTPVRSAQDWFERRRPEVLALFEQHMYGKTPTKQLDIQFQRVSQGLGYDGRAKRSEVDIIVPGKPDGPIRILIYLPSSADGPVPLFVGLNFYGNHSITNDPAVSLSQQWMRSNGDKGIVDHRATEASRGTSSSRWPIEQILERGYGVASIYCGDIDPDFDDGYQNGVHPAFYEAGQTRPRDDQWTTIGAWAWGLSRALDYFETDDRIDAKRVIVLGHSRLGKTSLWAGAQDPRFAVVISNNSGCGGAALSRRAFGETVARINTSFPHWFCGNFKKYNEKESELPIDQHLLVALIAPRPVMISSAVEDRWADPRGEYLAGKGADPVYRLLGTKGLQDREMPAADRDRVSLGRIGYRYRPGKHDVTREDWEAYMDFADHHLRDAKD